MKAPIFEEIGKVAWKYYMLFQQHTPPGGETLEDPSWVVGKETGPYIKQKSRSICTTLGKRVVFYGLDCRVDRTIDRICYKSTYDAMFERLETAVTPETRHFILLLGVPIAYPRYVQDCGIQFVISLLLICIRPGLFGWRTCCRLIL